MGLTHILQNPLPSPVQQVSANPGPIGKGGKWYCSISLHQKPVDREFQRPHHAFRRCFGIEVVSASLSLHMLAGPVAGGSKGASARCTALGDDVEPRRTRFFRQVGNLAPSSLGKTRNAGACILIQAFRVMARNMLESRYLVDTRKVMEQTKQAAKEQVRHYSQPQSEHKSPPSTEEIRRQLGWHLCHAALKSGS